MKAIKLPRGYISADWSAYLIAKDIAYSSSTQSLWAENHAKHLIAIDLFDSSYDALDEDLQIAIDKYWSYL